MPRPGYRTLNVSENRQKRIEALADHIGLDATKPAVWGAIIDFALGIAYWLVVKCGIDPERITDDSAM